MLYMSVIQKVLNINKCDLVVDLTVALIKWTNFPPLCESTKLPVLQLNKLVL